MSRLRLTIFLGLSTLVATLATGSKALANDSIRQVMEYGENVGEARVGQVTSVSQLSDVKPTDWAFQALQSLVERYGCIAGYPDKTYRGNRAMTRYEFAAGLNACMDRVNELIAAATNDLAKKEDVEALKKLQEEFAAELAEIRGKVDQLEATTDKLEKQQFSTTTKLNGEVIIAVGGVLGDDRALNADQWRNINAATTPATRESRIAAAYGTSPRDLQENTILGNRARIAFDASFTGKDRLRARLQARNLTSFSGNVTGTNATRLGFDGSNDNAVGLNRLEYRTNIGDQMTVFVGGGTDDGLEFNDSIATLSPTESSANGAISRFGRFNPIYRSGSGTGLIVNYKLGREFTELNKVTLSAGYLVPTGTASNPDNKAGLFNGGYSALAQLAYQPTPNLGLAFTYANSYYPTGSGISGSTGSGFANNPFNGAATSANAYGIQANVRISPQINISGWAGYTNAISKEQIATVGGQGTALDPAVRVNEKASIWNWSAALTFPDLFKEGNLGGVIFGMPPKVTANDFGPNTRVLSGGRDVTNGRRDRDNTYHLEAFYRYRLNDKVSITPGFLVIFNPESSRDNDNIYVGTLRTTFTF
jgi:hypothetical protein